MPISFAPRRPSAFLVLGALICLVLAACSPGGDYPSVFPSVHDVSPRSDTPLNSNQLQQATEDLISARDRLSAGTQDPQSKSSTGSAAKPAANSSANSSAKSSASSPANSATNSVVKSSAGKSAGKSSDKTLVDKSSAKPAPGPVVARKQPGTPVSAPQMSGADDVEQTPGTETK
jgi:hypothetical protein